MKKKEKWIEFTKEQKAEILPQLQEYLEENFDVEVSSLKAEFLLCFLTKNLGAYYYNQGIEDAITFMTQKTEDLTALIRLKETGK